MSSLGSDRRVGKLTISGELNFEPDANLIATSIVVKDTLQLDANCNTVGLTETFATDAELSTAETQR